MGKTFKKTSVALSINLHIYLASRRARGWLLKSFRPPTLAPMVLVAIFSVIVLLLCWLCYQSDYTH